MVVTATQRGSTVTDQPHSLIHKFPSWSSLMMTCRRSADVIQPEGKDTTAITRQWAESGFAAGTRPVRDVRARPATNCNASSLLDWTHQTPGHAYSIPKIPLAPVLVRRKKGKKKSRKPKSKFGVEPAFKLACAGETTTAKSPKWEHT